MRHDYARNRHVYSDTVDLGLTTNAIHRPSSGYSYSDADSYENERSMNPNVRYYFRENNRDLSRRDQAQEDSVDYSGRGPKSYIENDERIFMSVCDALSRNPDIDASEIEVAVNSGVVTLSGMVETRRVRMLAEELVQDLLGVKDVLNHIKVQEKDIDQHRIAHSLS